MPPKSRRLKSAAMKVHKHLELVVKQQEDVMVLKIKDHTIEFEPKSGDQGFVFRSSKSKETLTRWRKILTMMLTLVGEAEQVLEDES